jgi:hypothetical protein
MGSESLSTVDAFARFAGNGGTDELASESLQGGERADFVGY